MRLTWKRQESEKGLAAVCQGERGYDLRIDGQCVGRVRPVEKWGGGGYWWYAVSEEHGIPLKNTALSPMPTIGEAKALCLAYVKEHLRKERVI